EYGARFARYGYLEGKGLFSPRLAVSMTPASLFNATLTISRRLVAPGAEEFVPQGIKGLWLPPERTFAPIPGAALMPERIDHYDVAMDRSLFGMVVIGFQAFYQRVDHQTATLFDVRVPQEPVTHLGHYYVASAGDVKTRGWRVSLTRSFAPGLRGSVNYSRASAEWDATTRSGALVMLAPSAARLAGESFHDITSSIESEIPGTATRIVALYKLNTAFANTDATDEGGSQKGFGTRFDVQVNQSLPFLDFTNAQWEILVAVRTLFREADSERSVFDELLVVRPPKRIVSGLLVKF
ncbi:MAG: TonB-dependent receptor domain-containing protein, partial [Acidimicrobiia bacterium]